MPKIDMDELAQELGVSHDVLDLGGAMNDAVLAEARRIAAAGASQMAEDGATQEDKAARYAVSALVSAALAVARENREARSMLGMMLVIIAFDQDLPEPRTGTVASRARLAALLAAAEGN